MRASTRMDWIHVPALRLLTALPEASSVGAAARRVGMAQPNASRTIAMVERRTGVQIIERSPRGSTLTANGRLVVSWAKEALDALERFALDSKGLAENGETEISVGASQTVAEYLASAWIGRLRRTHPHVTVVLHMKNSEQVITGVVDATFDIGFIEAPHVPGHLNTSDIMEDPLKIVVSPDHEWAAFASRGKTISPEELAATPLMVRESGSGTRALLDEALSLYDRAKPLSELNSTSAIMRAARQGTGPAVLSGLAVEEELNSGRLVSVPVAGGPLTRMLRALWSGPAHLTGPAAYILDAALRIRGQDAVGGEETGRGPDRRQRRHTCNKGQTA